MTTTTSRFNSWIGSARSCFRAATAIDSSAAAVHGTVLELEGATVPAAQDALVALREAEAALVRAREAVQAALAARKLTAATREVHYGLVG